MKRGNNRQQSALATCSNTGNLPHSCLRKNQSPTATPNHRKVKHMQINTKDITVHRISDVYPGERDISNLRWKTHKKILRYDGSATSHCLCRPKQKPTFIDRSKRAPLEDEQWQRILEKAEKDARARAVQIHFEVVTMLGFALTSTFSCADQQARRVTAAQKAAHFASAPQRRWIYDTGCSASSIGRAQLTKAEKARTFSVAEMIYNTAS